MIPKLTHGRTQAQDRARRKARKAAAYARVCRLVDIRDTGICRACRRRRGEHHHHLTYRSRGGADTTANLVLLCATCHTAVHDGKLTFEVGRDGADGHLTPVSKGVLCSIF